jgi:N-acetylglutamate synthase-like GNAT family acetyltransferase
VPLNAALERSGMAPDYVVRVAAPEDAERVAKLLEASYPPLMAGAYDEGTLAPALKLMTRANPSLLASGTYYLAESFGHRVVGCGGWTLERPGTAVREPGLAHIRHFATDAAWTRRGVGRALYDRCEADARLVGVRAFECYSSLNAEAFYAALGFRRVRAFSIEFGPNVSLPAVLMSRKI